MYLNRGRALGIRLICRIYYFLPSYVTGCSRTFLKRWNQPCARILLISQKLAKSTPSVTCFRFSIAMYDMYKLVWAPHYLSLLQGYVTAWCEEGGVLNMVLLKYFRKEMKEDWYREVGVVQSLSCDEQLLSNVLHYRWHCKSKWPYFFQCNYQFRIAINFSHHFWNPRLLHRSLFHTDDFSLLLENGGGRGVGVDIWTLFREFKGVVLNFWSFLLLLFLFVASDLNIEQGKTKINDLQGNSL